MLVLGMHILYLYCPLNRLYRFIITLFKALKSRYVNIEAIAEGINTGLVVLFCQTIPEVRFHIYEMMQYVLTFSLL